MQSMSRTALGKVVQGKVEVEGEPLPEGARVVVHIGDDAEWELDEESMQELLQAAADAEHEEGISLEQLLDEMRSLR